MTPKKAPFVHHRESQVRITQVEGEAKAIAKWNGKPPQYIAPGSPVPFVNAKP